jgi:hypothetical protein
MQRLTAGSRNIRALSLLKRTVERCHGVVRGGWMKPCESHLQQRLAGQGVIDKSGSNIAGLYNMNWLLVMCD